MTLTNRGGISTSAGWVSYGPAGDTSRRYAGYFTGTTQGFPTASAIAASTGVSPLETSYSLYGHTIPLSVFGVGRIGGEIISGPWIENGLASFIISFGVPADPSGTRDLREIAFDSEVVWDSVNGFSTEAFTYRFYGGTLTQLADTLENTHFGADAIAYRPQILLAFSNLPLANTKFGKIPYVAAVIGDATGDDVNLGEAFERLAYSPWVGWTSGQFEASGITDGLVAGGLIIAQDAEFLATIQQFGRFYPSWDILQTDKLRIVDRGADLTADITLDKSVLMGNVVITRQEPNSVPGILELTTIDPEADYTLVPSRSQVPRAPVAVTTSIRTEGAFLPAIMESSTRASVVTHAKYEEDHARKQISFTAMAYGLEIEPGAIVGIAGLGDDFQNEAFKVKETLHGANYAVECLAEAILKCAADSNDPYLNNVVLLLGFEDVDGATGDPGMTDESPSAHGTATVVGHAQIDTGTALIGSSSILFDGTGDRITFPSSTDWRLATNNSDQYTIECFVKFATLTSNNRGIIGVNAGIGQVAWSLTGSSTIGELAFAFSTSGVGFSSTITTSGAGMTTGVRYHVAVDKDSSGKIRLYVDGVMYGSATPANSMIIGVGAPLAIGAQGSGGQVDMDGWVDEVRITKGVARYASDAGFTPPTSAFPRT